jgi:transposase-like protein
MANFEKKNPMILGIAGPGHTVEIDESKFGKRKHNRGRAVDGVWVFGGIDTTTRETFFVPVPDRSAATLIPIIEDNILKDTTVISDCWKAYNTVGSKGYQHLTVNHSLHFVDPDGIHTNTIESHWRVLKRSVLPKNGTQKSLLSQYFSVYCCFKRYISQCESDPFLEFLELIKRVYPLTPASQTPKRDVVISAGKCVCGGIIKEPEVSDITSSSDSEAENVPAKKAKRA